MLRPVAAACALLACATWARADGDRQNFWESLIAPNEREIQLVLTRARELRAAALAETDASPFSVPTADDRQRAARAEARLRDAYGMLRYARRELNPRHPDVLLELGGTADDLGRPAEAAEALEAYLAVAGDAAPGRGHALVRLGHIHAARGDWDRAVATLRTASSVAVGSDALQAQLSLGCAFMQVGRLEDAIAVLSRGATVQPGRTATETQSVAFALAVAYDRDEQITQAYDLLDTLTALDPGLSFVFGQRSTYAGANIPAPLLSPPSERHYFAALRFEARNMLVEARAEWSAYVRAVDGGAYVARARAHIEAIDAMLDDAMTRRPQ